VNDLGVDAAILFSDILVIPEAMGMNLKFTDRGPIFTNPLHDAENQVSSLVPDSSKLNHIYEAIDLIKERKPEDAALIGFCGAPFTTFCYMVQGNSVNHSFTEAINLLYGNKKTATEILEKITELSIEYATSQADHGVDAFQLFETHAGLIPSDVYIEMILPLVKRISNAVRDRNVPVIYFPKGLGLGISHVNHDIADFVSIDWQYSLPEARNVVDSRVGVQGNLDQRILAVKDRNVIERELEKFIPFGKKESKWIFNTGHGLSPDNTFENVKFVVDWIKNADWQRK
jgi:uroporphyrinogen decarboxylase